MRLSNKVYCKRYRLTHPEKREEIKAYLRKYMPKYRLQHKEEGNKSTRKYRRQHREELNNRKRESRHRRGISKRYLVMSGLSYTPQYKRVYRANRHARFKNAGKLTIQTIQQVYDENIIANSGVLKCIYCHRELTMEEATLEHKQPVSRGGTNAKENLAIACGRCNCSKNNKTVEEFLEYLKKEILEDVNRKTESAPKTE